MGANRWGEKSQEIEKYSKQNPSLEIVFVLANDKVINKNFLGQKTRKVRDISLDLLSIYLTWRRANRDRDRASKSEFATPRRCSASLLQTCLLRNPSLNRGNMAEGEEKLTGLAKHFNSQTMYGRANVSTM